MTEQLDKALAIAECGLAWPDHKDFPRVYSALEKVFKILTEIKGQKLG